MAALTQEQKEKYTAKVWVLVSPEKRYYATLTMDKVVSMSWVETHFKGGWSIKPLFPKEQETAQRKVERMKGK